MTNFSTEIIIPASGWVQNVKAGKKCQHGNYIPDTQEDQTYAQHCDVCNSLRAYMEKTGLDLETIYLRQRILWTELPKDKGAKGIGIMVNTGPKHMSLHAPHAEQFKRCSICDAQVIDGECEC